MSEYLPAQRSSFHMPFRDYSKFCADQNREAKDILEVQAAAQMALQSLQAMKAATASARKQKKVLQPIRKKLMRKHLLM